MIYYKKKSRFKKKIKNTFKTLGTVFFKASGGISKFNFKKIFTVLILAVLLFFIFLYFLYLLFLPRFLNEVNAEKYINNYLSKKTNITFDCDNLKISPGYKFDLRLNSNEISLFYKNDKKFVVFKNPEIEINLLTLCFGYLDFDKIKVEKVTLYVNFTKNNRYDIFDFVNPEIFTKQNSKFEIRNIHILSHEILINLYDENIKRNFSINLENSKLLYGGLNHFSKIITSGTIQSNKKIADLNLNISIKPQKNILSSYKIIKEKLNYNPLKDARRLNFYSKIDTELKISPKNKKYNIEGKIDLKDYTFLISNINFPKNNLLLVFKGDKIITDCNFNFIKNQFIKIKSTISISKNKFIEAKIISNEINLEDINDILDMALDKFRAQKISLSGSLKADLYLKSNFKKINSKGSLVIKDGVLYHEKTGLTLKNINSNISLENNKIEIIDAGMFFDDAKFNAAGTIDKDADLNLKINSDSINIAKVADFLKNMHLYSSNSEINNCIFKSGFLKINSQINGKLSSPQINANSTIEKLNFNYKPLNSDINADVIKINFKSQNKTRPHAFINIDNISILNKNCFLKIPSLKALYENGLIKIEKTHALANESEFDFYGDADLVRKEANLSFYSKIYSNNKFFTINNQDTSLYSNLIFTKDKITINNFNFDNFVSAKGYIANFSSKTPDCDIKISIPKKTYLDLKNLNSKFFIKGSINLSKNINNPEIDANLNIYDFLNNKFNLGVKDTTVNIKNSTVSINALDARFFGSSFDFSAQGGYGKGFLTLDYANIVSDYINLDEIEKASSNLKENNLKYEIKDLKGEINSLETKGISFNSFKFGGYVKDDIINISDFSSSLFQGSAKGEMNINLKTGKILADIILKEISIRHLSAQLKDLSIAASGKLSALLKIEFSGCELDEILKTAKGYIKFNINDGELAQFAKLERYLQAGNILSQSILKLSINSILSTVTKQNTGDFKTIEGTINLENSNAKIQYIKTSGSNMSTYITGNFNLLNQHANVKVLGRIPHSIVNVLGNVGKYNLNESVDKMEEDKKDTIKSITQSALEKKLSVEIPGVEADKIPPLAYKDVNEPTREFVVLINGNIYSVNSVKDFKWRLVE